MPSADYLHNHPEFEELIRIVANQLSLIPTLVEKDYWIMHCLYGLQQAGLSFELKGGTSLSKGYKIINRFSEDIDIRIEPPAYMKVETNPKREKPAHCESRRRFYDWLAETIKIDGIIEVLRHTSYDDKTFRNGGIKLNYPATTGSTPGLKEGILLEVGFDVVTPNTPKDIGSWAYDFAEGKVLLKDNRAKGVLCYHPGYTLVEKLQTISTKYRQQQEKGSFPTNFLRHYYDVYCLLAEPTVLSFIGTADYQNHKKARFRAADMQVISENPAFQLNDKSVRQDYESKYRSTETLYYKGQPTFSEIIERIKQFADRL
jgi:hypothetical protein